MPTISSSLAQPLVTPSTALFTSARANPCTAACESSWRIASRCPSFCSILMPTGSGVSSLPFGPCTATVLPSILTVTPFGIVIGFFPIRDIKFALSPQLSALGKIAKSCLRRLPNLAKHLAAQAFLARLSAGHHALRGGENIDTEPAQNARDLGAPHVNTAPGPRDTLHVRNGGFVVRAVLEVHTNDLVSLFFRRLVVRDVAFFFQNTGDLELQLRSGNIYLLVPRVNRIANTRQHVCDRIGQPHRLLLLCRPFAPHSAENLQRLTAELGLLLGCDRGARSVLRRPKTDDRLFYQDDFETPGISPFRARPRKHKRHTPNLRR